MTLLENLVLLLTPIMVIIATILQIWWANYKAHRQMAKIEKVHVLVNSRMTEALERIAMLEKKLGLAPGEEPLK